MWASAWGARVSPAARGPRGPGRRRRGGRHRHAGVASHLLQRRQRPGGTHRPGQVQSPMRMGLFLEAAEGAGRPLHGGVADMHGQRDDQARCGGRRVVGFEPLLPVGVRLGVVGAPVAEQGGQGRGVGGEQRRFRPGQPGRRRAPCRPGPGAKPSARASAGSSAGSSTALPALPEAATIARRANAGSAMPSGPPCSAWPSAVREQAVGEGGERCAPPPCVQQGTQPGAGRLPPHRGAEQAQQRQQLVARGRPVAVRWRVGRDVVQVLVQVWRQEEPPRARRRRAAQEGAGESGGESVDEGAGSGAGSGGRPGQPV